MILTDLFMESHMKTNEIASPMNNHGLIIPIVIVTVIALNMPIEHQMKKGAILKSITAISLEKRVKILPTGLASKNRMSALSTVSHTLLFMFVVAWEIKQKLIRPRVKLNRMYANTAVMNKSGTSSLFC